MRKIYLKLLIGIIVALWIFYFIQSYSRSFYHRLNEGFTPRINSIYRPYIRNINNYYETFIDNYGFTTIMTKLKKWNIY
jgi:hypothetical protein